MKRTNQGGHRKRTIVLHFSLSMPHPREHMRLGNVAIVFLSVEDRNEDGNGGRGQWADTL